MFLFKKRNRKRERVCSCPVKAAVPTAAAEGVNNALVSQRSLMNGACQPVEQPSHQVSCIVESVKSHKQDPWTDGAISQGMPQSFCSPVRMFGTRHRMCGTSLPVLFCTPCTSRKGDKCGTCHSDTGRFLAESCLTLSEKMGKLGVCYRMSHMLKMFTYSAFATGCGGCCKNLPYQASITGCGACCRRCSTLRCSPVNQYPALITRMACCFAGRRHAAAEALCCRNLEPVLHG
jgi:hypothetical protein